MFKSRDRDVQSSGDRLSAVPLLMVASGAALVLLADDLNCTSINCERTYNTLVQAGVASVGVGLCVFGLLAILPSLKSDRT